MQLDPNYFGDELQEIRLVSRSPQFSLQLEVERHCSRRGNDRLADSERGPPGYLETKFTKSHRKFLNIYYQEFIIT